MGQFHVSRSWRWLTPAEMCNSNCWKRWATVCLCTLLMGKMLLTTQWSDSPSSGISSGPHRNHHSDKELLSQQSPSFSVQKERSLKSIKPTHESQFSSATEHEEVHPLVSAPGREKFEETVEQKQRAPVPEKVSQFSRISTEKNIFVPPMQTVKEWTALKEQEYERRKRKVRQICEGNPVYVGPVLTEAEAKTQPHYPYIDQDPPVERPNRGHFTLASSFKTMGCFINKVASSSLVSAFLIVNGYGTSFSSPHSLAPRLQPQGEEEFGYANASHFKFMFVRHPMERLLSCYRDKMLTSPHWSLPTFRLHVKARARQIMEQRRLPQSPYVPKTQRKLLQYVPSQVDHQIMNEVLNSDMGAEMAAAAEALNRLAAAQQNKDLGKPSSPQNTESMNILRQNLRQQNAVQQSTVNNIAEPGKESDGGLDYTEKPTFEEFLEYILSTDLQGNGYDAHWVPYWRYCTPCNVPYDMIGKIETAMDDLTYVWRRTGLDRKVPIPWFNRQLNADKNIVQRKFYVTLPRSLILRVYQRFRLDFEMFEYSINEVLVDAGYQPLPNVN